MSVTVCWPHKPNWFVIAFDRQEVPGLFGAEGVVGISLPCAWCCDICGHVMQKGGLNTPDTPLHTKELPGDVSATV
jgi:hypothetical protein